ncbi:MAG: cupredoxin domain-containing protein [Tepidiformaceae bacterium]
MGFKRRKRFAGAAIASAAALFAALLVGAGAAFADASPTPSTTATATATAGTTVNAKVGQGETGFSVNAFLPQDITVKTGTTVNWSFTWFEPHMIVLDNGLTPADLSGPEPPADTSPFDFDGVRKYVYSGEIFGQPVNPPTFAIKFEKAGTYNIECLIHSGMTGKVTVVDSGTTDTQAAADSRAQTEYNTAITALKAAIAQHDSTPETITPQADGSNLFQVDMLDAVGGVGGTSNYVQQFLPSTVNIKAGDSVIWENKTLQNVHTVTFNVDNSGLDPATTDPFEVPPAVPANNTYDGGTEFVHSGILGGSSGNGPDDPTSVANPQTFTLKFTTPGTYSYICLLHGDQGMTGTVNVAAQVTPPKTPTVAPTVAPTSAPQPPNTGSGANGGGTSPFATLAIVAALFVLMGAGAATVAFRRH